MLIRKPILDLIQSGEVTLAFRRWKKPTVQQGGTLKTAVGVLAIERVKKIAVRDITAADARRAGFDNREALLAELGQREGNIYRIALKYIGADPRVALRQLDDLSDDELAAITARLDRLDAASRVGPWTRKVLRAIKRHPMLPAVKLAETTGFEKDWLKTNVRKLKNLGLTVSHHPGYTLSPRGKAVLAVLVAAAVSSRRGDGS